MKKICLIMISTLTVITIIISSAIIMATHPSNMLTDSGWDTDYGGSSSWSSGSSWDSGSSWSSSRNHDYSYHDYDYGSRRTSSKSNSNAKATPEITAAFLIIIVVSFIIFIEIINATSKKNSKYNEKEIYKNSIGDADIDIQGFFPNMTEEQLLDILYKRFVEVQIAWMDFDYQKLEKLCTNELYSSYKSDLEILKEKNGKNIMNGFNLVHYNINGITEENGIISVNMFLHVAFHDYVIDTTTEEVTRGNKDGIVHNQYILTFITRKQDDIIKCPSCGSEVEKGASNCSYCNTIINHNYADFVLSTKKKIY